jgi:hypothetical protein
MKNPGKFSHQQILSKGDKCFSLIAGIKWIVNLLYPEQSVGYIQSNRTNSGLQRDKLYL